MLLCESTPRFVEKLKGGMLGAPSKPSAAGAEHSHPWPGHPYPGRGGGGQRCEKGPNLRTKFSENNFKFVFPQKMLSKCNAKVVK